MREDGRNIPCDPALTSLPSLLPASHGIVEINDGATLCNGLHMIEGDVNPFAWRRREGGPVIFGLVWQVLES